MTVANELRVEDRRPPRMPGAAGGECAARTIHRVSAVDGQRCRRHPQHQTGDAGGLGGQRQLAAGDEIELPRLAPHFQHHGAHRIAAERIGRRPQRAVDIGCAHAYQQTRIEPEFGQPAGRQRPRFNFGEILPDPDQRPAWRPAPSAPR